MASASRPPADIAYARVVTFLLWILVIAVVVGAGAWAWSRRSFLIAKALGQPESRIKRQIEQRRDSSR